MHVLGEHNGTKIEFYRTNTKSHGLVPAQFALIIIIVVHVVKHHDQSVLINTCRRQERLRMMLGSSSMYIRQLNCSYSYIYPSNPRLVVTVFRLHIYGLSKWSLTQLTHTPTPHVLKSIHVQLTLRKKAVTI